MLTKTIPILLFFLKLVLIVGFSSAVNATSNTDILNKLESLLSQAQGSDHIHEVTILEESNSPLYIAPNYTYEYNQPDFFPKLQNSEGISPLPTSGPTTILVNKGKEVIYIRTNVISEKIIKNLKHLKKLKGLTIVDSTSKDQTLNLSTLDQLQYLAIFSSKFSKIILPESSNIEIFTSKLTKFISIENLEKLNKLKVLQIHDSKLTELINLPLAENLTYLDISINKKLTRIPDLKMFPDLLYLDFNSYRVKNVHGIESLKKLKHLNTGLHFNYSDITFPSSIISLSTGGLSNLALPTLKNSGNIEQLTITNTKATEIPDWSNLSNLKELTLTYNNIHSMRGIESLSSLQTLTLNSNKISEIEGLNNLSKLKKVYLEDNQIRAIKNLKPSKPIEFISLYGNPIEKLDFNELKNLPYTKINILGTPAGNNLTKEDSEKLKTLQEKGFIQ